MNGAAKNPGALIGRGLDRVDGRLKVMGGARYAADALVANAAHAVAVGSRVARGRIRGIDESWTRAIPGVISVITYQTAQRLPRVPFDQEESPYGEEDLSPLQSDEIMYFGQYVAVVIAETFEAARAGAQALVITYDRAPSITSIDDVRDDAKPIATFFGTALQYQRGDAAGAFTSAAVSIDATYTTPSENHNPIEPHVSIAAWEDDRLTVHDASQWVMGMQKVLAAFFELDAQNVRVICPFVGGGFGSKGFAWSHPVIAAMAAKAIGRPVKLVITREQMFSTTGHRSPTEQRLRLAADKDGTLLAALHDVVNVTSRVGTYVERAGIVTPYLYKCANVGMTHRTGILDIGTPNSMRAPGEAPGTYALEAAMDELAYALHMDPLALRLKNETDRDDSEGQPFSSRALRACFMQGAERFEWSKRSHAPRSMRDGNEFVGWGLATATYPAMRSKATARVIIGANGRATVASATHDLGTGTYTILTQIAADSLGIEPADIDVRIGDSSLPLSPVAGGSQSAASVGPAVAVAAADVRAQAIAIACSAGGSVLRGCTPDDIEIVAGFLRLKSDTERALTFADIVRLNGNEPLDRLRTTEPGKEEDEFSFYSFGAQFCEVRYDEDLARVRVTRFLSVIDAGRILNPKTARSQIIGGVTMGIGMGLFEETVRDHRYGSPITDNLADYHVPVNADIPELDVIFIEQPDLRFNPLGVRGVGEIGITGVAAAVANAVYHASGVRVRDLPIVPEKLLASRELVSGGSGR